MLNPASAFVRACKLIVDVIMFFVEKGSQIAELVNAVLDSVEAIADGAIGVAAKLVEGALAKALPVVIGFLASLIGLGGISGKIQDLIKKACGLIDSAVNWVLSKALAFVKKLGGRLGLGRNNSNRPDQRTEAQKKEDLRAALSKSEKLLRNDKISLEGVKKRLPAIKDKHKLVSLALVVDNQDGNKETVHVHGTVNPEDDTDKVERKSEKIIRRSDLEPGEPSKTQSSWDIALYVNVENGKTEWCVASVNLDKDGMPDKRGPTMYVTTHNLKINNQVIEKLRIEGGGSFTDIALEEVNKAYKNSFGSEPKSLQISLAESNLANFKREFARYKKQKPSASDDEAAQHSIRQISAGKKRFDHGYTNFRIELSGWSEENLGRDVGLSRVPAKVDVIAEKP